jgi:hypothetical protein
MGGDEGWMKQYLLACSYDDEGHDDRASLGGERVQKLGQAQMRGMAKMKLNRWAAWQHHQNSHRGSGL